MDAVTYPDASTIEVIEQHLIPVRVQITSEPALAGKFKVRYTPTVIVLDGDGSERQRTVGFLPPAEFIPALLLGIGKSLYFGNRFKQASRVLDRLLVNYPDSRWASEASNLKRAGDKRAS
ncbi:MAG: hypothetical protein RDU20_20985 [Desulfomonilaceae bacterium]|nr:hypothetical protein [Desulfomonilaceae bacterium]